MVSGLPLQSALLGVLALVCYGVATVYYVTHLRHPKASAGRVATGLAIVGTGLNFAFLYARSLAVKSVPYHDLLGSMALFGFFLAAMNLILEARHHDRSLGPFLMPGALLLVLLAFFLPETGTKRPDLKGAIFAFHVTLNMLAYAAFAVASALALLYLVLVRKLKSHKKDILRGSASRLPSLSYLERANRTSLGVGLVAHTVGLAMGFTWAYRVWREVHSVSEVLLDAKVVTAVVTLVFYAVVVVRAHRGAAPVTTARLSLAGFALVLVSYTAVNLVLSKVHVFT